MTRTDAILSAIRIAVERERSRLDDPRALRALRLLIRFEENIHTKAHGEVESVDINFDTGTVKIGK